MKIWPLIKSFFSKSSPSVYVKSNHGNNPYSSSYSRYSPSNYLRYFSQFPQIIAFKKVMDNNVIGNDPPIPTFTNVKSQRDMEMLIEFWNSWSERVSVSGDESWGIYLRQLVQTYVISGKVFTLIRYHEDYNYGVGLQVLTRDCLDTTFGTIPTPYKMVDGEKLVAYRGEVFANSGRKVGYLFRSNSFFSNSPFSSTFPSQAYMPTLDVLYLKNISDYGNVDHFPEDLISIQEVIDNINKIEKSYTNALMIAASKMGFIVSKNESDVFIDPVLPDGDIQEQGGSLPSQFTGSAIETLPPGFEFQSFDASGPTGDVVGFRKDMQKLISATLGIDYATNTGDLSSTNYSSTKYGAAVTRDAYRSYQKIIEEQICRPLIKRLILKGVEGGYLKFKSPKSIDQCLMTPWKFRAWSSIDAIKESVAAKHNLSSGVTSPQRVASSLGVDIENILTEVKQFKNLLEKNGLTMEDLSKFK